MAYALRLEDLAREHQALTIAAGVAQALGKQVEADTWETVRARFDEALSADPGEPAARDDSPRGIKLRVLGVRV